MDSEMMKGRIINRLKNHKATLSELDEKFKIGKEGLGVILAELEAQGTNIVAEWNKRKRETEYHISLLPDNSNVYIISGPDDKKRTMNIAICSDLHFASKFHLPKTFHEAMKRTEDAGITRVYVAGDIHDGRDIYNGHLENLVSSSIEDQTDMSAEALSAHPNLEFWGIAGNHDYSFTKKVGAKPLAILESKCDNFKNLGDLKADVIYHGIRIRLLHGAGGRAYARSYPSQTYLRDFFSGLDKRQFADIPDVMAIGHYHTFYVGKDHGIIIVQPTSFQDGDNEYCVRRGLTGPNGLVHLTMQYQNGVVNDFNTELIQPAVSFSEKGSGFKKTSVSYSRR